MSSLLIEAAHYDDAYERTVAAAHGDQRRIDQAWRLWGVQMFNLIDRERSMPVIRSPHRGRRLYTAATINKLSEVSRRNAQTRRNPYTPAEWAERRRKAREE